MQQERLNIIRDYLSRNRTASISDLSQILNVSVVTVRKDLTEMESMGFLKRIHGGAVAFDAERKERAQPNVVIPPSNEIIAELASKLIMPGDFIFLGSGRTCFALAERIKDIKDLSVITNNITAVSVLLPNVSNLVLLGGEVLETAGGVVTANDLNAASSLESVYVNKAFTSGVGIDSQIGLTVNTVGSSNISKCMPKLCSEWYVLMDSSKFGVKAFYQAGSTDQITCMVTDVTDESILDKYKAGRMKVIHP